jgi:hypothetical protein
MIEITWGTSGNVVENYRWYQCALNCWGDYTCKKTEYPGTIHDDKTITRLVSIRKEIPEVFDTIVIKHELTPRVKVIGK